MGRDFDTGDSPALDFPARGAVAKRTMAPYLFQFGMGIAIHEGASDVALDHAVQHRIAGQPEDVADAVALAPCHPLGAAIVVVAADDDLDRRPPGAQGPHDVAEHQGDFRAGRGFARPQEHRHGLSRRRLVNMDRHEAVAVVMGIESDTCWPP